MFAIVEIAGDQFKVLPKQKVKVPLLKAGTGEIINFTKVLAASGDDSNINIGTPLIDGSITAKVLEHGRSDKVLVFHKKRRKGYRKLNGHRQDYTLVEIMDFNIPGFEYINQISEKPNKAKEDIINEKDSNSELNDLVFKDSDLQNDTSDEKILSFDDIEDNEINLETKEEK